MFLLLFETISDRKFDNNVENDNVVIDIENDNVEIENAYDSGPKNASTRSGSGNLQCCHHVPSPAFDGPVKFGKE